MISYMEDKDFNDCICAIEEALTNCNCVDHVFVTSYGEFVIQIGNQEFDFDFNPEEL